MTNKLVVIINSLKVPKIEKILLYEMKFIVPKYGCLQNPWIGGYAPRSPFSLSSALNWICWTPPPKKIPGYATADTHSEYVILIAFPRQFLRERASMSLLHVNFPLLFRITLSKHLKLRQSCSDRRHSVPRIFLPSACESRSSSREVPSSGVRS